MNKQQMTDLAQAALSGIRERGIADAIISIDQSRNVSVVYRKRRPDKVEESTRRSISVSLYDEGKYSVSGSNDFRPEAMKGFLDNAVAMTRAMQADPYRMITEASLYEGRRDLDLKRYDPQVDDISNHRRNQLAAEAEAATLASAGDGLVSAEATMETQVSDSFQLHSNGFSGYERGTQMWLFAEVSLRDSGEKRPSGWEVLGSRFVSDFGRPEDVGHGAVVRARQKLGPTRIDTGQYAMILENRAVGRLLGGLIGATSGRALQQKRSFLDGMRGQSVASSQLTMIDNPFIEKGFASRLFDGEGISAQKMPVVENGVLKNYYVDTYYGKKLNMPPTTGSRSNLVVAPGQKSLDEMVRQVDRGILVRGFVGGNANGTTGDFSFGVYGTLIENGKLTRPISEANISGNHRQLWQRLVDTGNEPWKYSSLISPSLLFDDIQFSGN